MLVLSRRLGESIVIGKDVIVTVIEIRRSRIRLAFESKSGANIVRSELLIDRPHNEYGNHKANQRRVRNNKVSGTGQGVEAGASVAPPEILTIKPSPLTNEEQKDGTV